MDRECLGNPPQRDFFGATFRNRAIDMIRRLQEGLGIPAESLIKMRQHKAA
jgi:hypothetical protein